MSEASLYMSFPPFRINLRAARLERGDVALALRPKAYALLLHLVLHRGELLKKEDLLDALWPGRIITEGGLTELVRELRRILGDDARGSRYIETVHGRGYRFIAPLHDGPSTATSKLVPVNRPVGRDAELGQLAEAYAHAEAGQRQLVFVTGEPGIGKTTLVESFLQALAGTPRSVAPRICRGQCIEQYGSGEAYLPILDAFGRLARLEQDQALIDLLRQHAPTWLVQMPALLDGVELEQLERRTLGATRERMLREMAESLEVISGDRPVLLVLEDVHWSDYSTLELMTFVAQRREPARLMILATFRPVEVYSRDHPLKGIKQELDARGQCRTLDLPCLAPGHVEEYLEHRFAGMTAVPQVGELARVVHRRTEGHPLFMVNVADYVAALGFSGLPESVMSSIPGNVRQMIDKQIDRLGPLDQKILEVAAVAGFQFSIASLAAGLGETDLDAIEDACMAMVRREQFLIARGRSRWPDGTVTGVYGFIHALYQNVFYFRISPGRLARLHLRIGLREEQGWGARVADIASELAAHFEAGEDYARALDYLAIAGEKAAKRCADREAIALFSHALQLLPQLGDVEERARHELRLSIALGVPLIHARGYAASEVGEIYRRARELQERVGERSQLFLVLWGLWLFEVVRGNHAPACELGYQLQAMERDEKIRFPLADYATGCSLFWLGNFTAALETLERAVASYDPEVHGQQIGLYSQDPKAVSLLYRGWALWILGYPDQALASCEASAEWSSTLGHPFSLAFAHDYCAVLAHLRRDPAQALRRGEDATAVAAAHGFPLWEAWGGIMCGKALSAEDPSADGIERMQAGVAAYEATGAGMGMTLFLSLLAEAQLGAAQHGAALATLDAARACAARSGEAAFLPELHRLEGELLMATDPPDIASAERCLVTALEIARRQEARSWELRAATSLARLHLSAGRKEQARMVLAPIHGWFTEGQDTLDSRAAGKLLAELAC